MNFCDVFEDVTRYGRKLQTSEYKAIGKYPIFDQGQNQTAGYTDEKTGLYSDVPVVLFGDHTRVVKYIDQPCFLGADGVKLLKSKLIDANPKYLYYAVRAVDIPDTGYNRHYKWLKEANIRIVDRQEQDRIVCDLDKIECLITVRKQQLQKLDELIKARFFEMFGEENAHGVPLKECCIDVRGGGTPSMQHPEYYGGNVPFIKSGDIRGDMVSSGALWLTEKALEETTAKLVPQGSVLVVNRSAALLREFKAAIAARPVVINQDIKAFIPKHEYNSQYLLWAIKIQTRLLLTKVTTILTSHIDLRDLLELRIANASIGRQKEFSVFISQVDKSKLSIQASLDQLETLKQSLMQKYFG